MSDDKEQNELASSGMNSPAESGEYPFTEIKPTFGDVGPLEGDWRDQPPDPTDDMTDEQLDSAETPDAVAMMLGFVPNNDEPVPDEVKTLIGEAAARAKAKREASYAAAGPDADEDALRQIDAAIDRGAKGR